MRADNSIPISYSIDVSAVPLSGKFEVYVVSTQMVGRLEIIYNRNMVLQYASVNFFIINRPGYPQDVIFKLSGDTYKFGIYNPVAYITILNATNSYKTVISLK